MAADAPLLASEADPVHPLRIYGELARFLDSDAVVIGDGGDFVSYAGKYIEPQRPGGWLDPGPYGCLGTGLGYAIAARIARPSAQVVLLLGDGAAGFSLMDADTLVRHALPVVMICGNNGIWGLEKHPMQALYGYDVAADLQPQCRYDQVVSALGGAGELVTRPADIAPALRRAFDSTSRPTRRTSTRAPPPACKRARPARAVRIGGDHIGLFVGGLVRPTTVGVCLLRPDPGDEAGPVHHDPLDRASSEDHIFVGAIDAGDEPEDQP